MHFWQNFLIFGHQKQVNCLKCTGIMKFLPWARCAGGSIFFLEIHSLQFCLIIFYCWIFCRVLAALTLEGGVNCFVFVLDSLRFCIIILSNIFNLPKLPILVTCVWFYQQSSDDDVTFAVQVHLVNTKFLRLLQQHLAGSKQINFTCSLHSNLFYPYFFPKKSQFKIYYHFSYVFFFRIISLKSPETNGFICIFPI